MDPIIPSMTNDELKESIIEIDDDTESDSTLELLIDEKPFLNTGGKKNSDKLLKDKLPVKKTKAITDYRRTALYQLIQAAIYKKINYGIKLSQGLNDKNEVKLIRVFQEYWKNKCKRNCKYLYSLSYSIGFKCLKLLLSRWNRWDSYDGDFSDKIVQSIYNELRTYIDMHVVFLKPRIHECIKKIASEEMKGQQLQVITFNEYEEALEIQSNYKELKSYFQSEPLNSKLFWNLTGTYTLKETMVSGPVKFLLNWPFISIRMILPFFEMIHQNSNYNEFLAVNLNITNLQNKKFTPQNDTSLYSQTMSPSHSFLSSFIIRYLSQLKDLIKLDKTILNNKKDDFLAIVTEFQKDISLCYDTIDTNTMYYKSLTKYPYVRYLSNPRCLKNNDVNITIVDQVNLNEDTNVNVRLQQTTYPSIKFKLVKFGVLYEESEKGEINFMFHNQYLSNIRSKSLIYECLLCNEIYESFMGAYQLIQHLNDMHGVEPDWTCTKCFETYNTKHLAENRWQHSCQ